MSLALCRIIGPERQVKKVLAVHSLMHHKIGVQGRALSGLERRRTDDSLGRSAAFNRAYRHGSVQRECAVARIRNFEFSAHRLVQRLATEIDLLLIKC